MVHLSYDIVLYCLEIQQLRIYKTVTPWHSCAGAHNRQRYTSFNLFATSALEVSGRSAPQPRSLYPPEKTLSLCTKCWVGLRVRLEGHENCDSPGIRSSDLPSHSESLYRLSYPGRFSDYRAKAFTGKLKIKIWKNGKRNDLGLFSDII